jgi:hypothetical protein
MPPGLVDGNSKVEEDLPQESSQPTGVNEPPSDVIIPPPDVRSKLTNAWFWRTTLTTEIIETTVEYVVRNGLGVSMPACHYVSMPLSFPRAFEDRVYKDS